MIKAINFYVFVSDNEMMMVIIIIIIIIIYP